MKKLLLIIIACMFLSGCSFEKNVGIIGGADGPTEIFVSDKQNNVKHTEKDEIWIVKLDNSLYYEVDKDNETDRNTQYDGELKRTAEKYEIPVNNGECNFSDGKKWRKGSASNTIEVLIEDDWEIFSKIDTNADVFQYKYCYVVEGILPNAKVDSEFLVLSNDLDVSFEDASYKMLGSDVSKMKDIYVLPIAD